MTNSNVRTLIESWSEAIRAGDMNGILDRHTKDILMFNVPEPLQSKGMAAYKKNLGLVFRAAVTLQLNNGK